MAKATSKPPSKTEIFANIADATGLSKRDVGNVFESLNDLRYQCPSTKSRLVSGHDRGEAEVCVFLAARLLAELTVKRCREGGGHLRAYPSAREDREPSVLQRVQDR